MFNYIQKKSYTWMCDYIKSNYELIKPIAGKCRFNYKCFFNSVHDAMNNGEDRVALVMYIDEGQPIIHFINVNSSGIFTENTFGVWCDNYEYYLIKYINDDEFSNIVNVFKDFRVEIFKKLPFIFKLFLSSDNF